MNSFILDQPQPDYLTSYCGVGTNGGFRAGNALSPGQNLIGGLQGELNMYNNAGPFLGVRGVPKNSFGQFEADFGGPNPATSIYSDYTMGGARLARPYGPRDSSSMKGLHLAGSLLPPVDLTLVGQFGRYKKHKRRSLRKSIRMSEEDVHSIRHSRKRSARRRFGSTPGTSAWTAPRLVNNKDSTLFFEPNAKAYNKYFQDASVKYSINMPMQFRNNQYNTPKLAKFGSCRPSLYYMEGPNNVGYQPDMALYNGYNFGGIMTLMGGDTNSGGGNFMWNNPAAIRRKKFGKKVSARTNRFGAGANTTNWLTGKSYRPPENPNILSVQYDPANPRAWLSMGDNILVNSSLPNGARKYTALGTTLRDNSRRLNFGSDLVYNIPQFAGAQAGPQIVEQPLPLRMQIESQIPVGSYVSYGLQSKRRRSNKKITPIHILPQNRKVPSVSRRAHSVSRRVPVTIKRAPSTARHHRVRKVSKTNYDGKTITLNHKNKVTIE